MDKEGLTGRKCHCYVCIAGRRKDVLMRIFFIRVMVNGSKHGLGTCGYWGRLETLKSMFKLCTSLDCNNFVHVYITWTRMAAAFWYLLKMYAPSLHRVHFSILSVEFMDEFFAVITEFFCQYVPVIIHLFLRINLELESLTSIHILTTLPCVQVFDLFDIQRHITLD